SAVASGPIAARSGSVLLHLALTYVARPAGTASTAAADGGPTHAHNRPRGPPCSPISGPPELVESAWGKNAFGVLVRGGPDARQGRNGAALPAYPSAPRLWPTR